MRGFYDPLTRRPMLTRAKRAVHRLVGKPVVHKWPADSGVVQEAAQASLRVADAARKLGSKQAELAALSQAAILCLAWSTLLRPGEACYGKKKDGSLRGLRIGDVDLFPGTATTPPRVEVTIRSSKGDSRSPRGERLL